jgi:hypothetical protein
MCENAAVHAGTGSRRKRKATEDAVITHSNYTDYSSYSAGNRASGGRCMNAIGAMRLGRNAAGDLHFASILFWGLY